MNKFNQRILFYGDRIELPKGMYWEIEKYDNNGRFLKRGNISFSQFPQATCLGKKGDSYLFHLIPANSVIPVTAYCKILTHENNRRKANRSLR